MKLRNNPFPSNGDASKIPKFTGKGLEALDLTVRFLSATKLNFYCNLRMIDSHSI